MSRAALIRALVALCVLAGASFFALTTPARLGLDLRGGTQIVLETQSTDRVTANAETTDRALEVLRGRVDALGVSEPTLARAGDRRIIIELPGVQDPREAAEVIGRTAQLAFHPVLSAGDPAPTPSASGSPTPSPTPSPASSAAPSAAAPSATPSVAPPAGVTPLEERTDVVDEDGAPIRLGPQALTGEEVSDASAQVDPTRGPGWFVTLDFRGGGTPWRELTGQAACAAPGDPARRVAIVLDDQVISSPQVDPSIACGAGIGGGTTEITGQFGSEEARDLAALIKGGALPLPVEVIEQRTVGPTLGADAIDASVQAAIVGVILTGLFITVVYRLMGLLATVALGCYALISYATLVALGATLTLPGLAGFVLAIGMAIDANVLVFERAREEYRRASILGGDKGAGPTGLRGALATGFAKAWSAIIDSNVTTLIAGGLLFFLASGPVKGFGVTLSIGVLASMVSALLIARVLTEWAVRRGAVTRRPGTSGLSGTGRVRAWIEKAAPDLMGRSRTWLAVSAAVLAVSVAGIMIRGLDLGVEFTGGRLLEFSTTTTLDADEARSAVADAGFPRAVVQSSGEDDITVRTEELTNDEAFAIEQALGAAGGPVDKIRDELIGPSLGEELRRNAIIAFVVALGAQMLYLAVRFRPTIGAAAVLAMFHDVVAVLGLFAWLGKSIDGVFLAAALTIIGLSINDSVVVFDRVRELRRARPRDEFSSVVNSAILQTVPRTVNTGLGAMFILAALVFYGGDTLTDFALALLVGLIVGTWSSSFTAAPLAILFQRRWPDDAPVRVAAVTRPGGGTEGRRTRVVDPADPYAFVDADPEATGAGRP